MVYSSTVQTVCLVNSNSWGRSQVKSVKVILHNRREKWVYHDFLRFQRLAKYYAQSLGNGTTQNGLSSFLIVIENVEVQEEAVWSAPGTNLYEEKSYCAAYLLVFDIWIRELIVRLLTRLKRRIDRIGLVLVNSLENIKQDTSLKKNPAGSMVMDMSRHVDVVIMSWLWKYEMTWPDIDCSIKFLIADISQLEK